MSSPSPFERTRIMPVPPLAPAPHRDRSPIALIGVVGVVLVALLTALFVATLQRTDAATADVAETAVAIDTPAPVVTEPVQPVQPTPGQPAPSVPNPGVEAITDAQPTPVPTVAPETASEPDPVDLTDEDEDALEPFVDEATDTDGPAEPVTLPAPAPVEPPAPVELEPVDTSPEAHPCDDVLADGANLLVQDPIVLADGSQSGTVAILNCGESAVNWTAATKPWVALAQESGNLGGGSSTELAFTVDRDGVDLGAYEFKIKVSEPGHNTYVDVHGFKAVIGSELTASNSFTNGPVSCATGCIKRAELFANASSPNMSIQVETRVPANVAIRVSTHEPIDGPDGPVFPSVTSFADSPGEITEWTGSLTGLTADTTYNIIAVAVDADGNVDSQVGSFRTTTPVTQGIDEFVNEVPGGCSQQCITKAVVSADANGGALVINVETLVPAALVAAISTEAPVWNDGTPSFTDVDRSTGSNSYVTNWGAVFAALPGSATYHVIVNATDEQGRTSHQVGEFTTPADPVEPQTAHGAEHVDVVIVPLRTKVLENGDHIGRGEIRFAWQVGNDYVASRWDERGRSRMEDGESFWHPFHNQYLIPNVASDGVIPAFWISAMEHDPDLKSEFSANGLGPHTWTEYGELEGDDEWFTTASTGLLTPESLDTLPRCWEFNMPDAWADQPCMRIESPRPGGYAHFWTVVAFQVLPAGSCEVGC